MVSIADPKLRQNPKEGSWSKSMAAAGNVPFVPPNHSTIGFSGPLQLWFKVLNFLDSLASQFLQEDDRA
jgi:hypothetical protein